HRAGLEQPGPLRAGQRVAGAAAGRARHRDREGSSSLTVGVAERRRGAAAPVAASRLLRLPSSGTVVCTLVLAVVAFLVLYPLWLLLLNSFQVGVAGRSTTWGLANWQATFTEPTLWSSVVNTVTLAGTRQALALLIGIPIAWLVARTDLPGRHWL